ncbi:MAG: metallopeptidase TldD-related protein [Bacteroidota bacterium]|nr:metallopeptidase TldD-related protein [Candidatus Kapabacteria bacterium]MDW8220071.1 metallopeptidase TldD-related protein [Bacteroidota bacterium]
MVSRNVMRNIGNNAQFGAHRVRIGRIVTVYVAALHILVALQHTQVVYAYSHGLQGLPVQEVLRAMRDELQRSLQYMYLPSLERPYYIHYVLTDAATNTIKASFGSLIESRCTREKRLTVGVRVGSMQFDNTNFFDPSLGFFGSTDDEERFKQRIVPDEIDYASLRRELWLATDAAYKQAAEMFAKKQAALQNRIRMDTLPDYMPAKPFSLADTMPIPDFDKAYYEHIAVELSRVFRGFPAITLSSVTIEYNPKQEIFVSTEGREYIRTELICGVEVVAIAQAYDGMPLVQVYSAYSRTPAGLPSKDSLLKAVRGIAAKLSHSVVAPLTQSYSGPILFEEQAAGEVFVQVFAPNLVTQRSPITERGISDNPQHGAFQNKIGARVMPEFLSVAALPSLSAYGASQLVGSFRIDDEGTPAESFDVVKNGYLKGLMSSRTPTRRVKASNGHNRGGAAMFAVLELSATKERSYSPQALRTMMMQLCKNRDLPYGIIVRKMLNPNILMTTLYNLTEGDFPFARTPGQLSVLEAYRLYPDGREELIRGCDIVGLTVQSFKDILAVGNRKYAYNCYALPVTLPFFTGGAQFLPVSVIVPPILFEDAEVRPVEDDFTRPPILHHPFFSAQ